MGCAEDDVDVFFLGEGDVVVLLWAPMTRPPKACGRQRLA